MVGMAGSVAAQSPVSWLLTLGPWQNISLINAALGIVLTLVVAKIVQNGPLNQIEEGNVPSSWAGLKEVVQRPLNWFASFYTCFLNLPIMIFGTLFGNWYLVSTYGVSNQIASLMMSVMYIGFIVGCPFMGWCFDRVSNTRGLMMTGVVIQVLLLAVLTFMPEQLNESTLMLIFFGIGFSSSTHTLSYPLITLSNSSHSASIGLSLSALVIMGGVFCSQPIFGKLLGDSLESPNFTLALKWLMIFTALGLVSSGLIRQKNKSFAATAAT
jgi:predicted MFS family arabinose efflux permease